MEILEPITQLHNCETKSICLTFIVAHTCTHVYSVISHGKYLQPGLSQSDKAVDLVHSHVHAHSQYGGESLLALVCILTLISQPSADSVLQYCHHFIMN